MNARYRPHWERALSTANPRRRPWTSEELEIVLEVYPRGGPQAVQRLIPHRTRAAIQAVALRHNIASRDRASLLELEILDCIPDFDTWCKDHGHDLWMEYEQSGPHYDTNYPGWLEDRYARMFGSS